MHSTLIENYTQRILMTRRENTIFYHEKSVEIPKEEPFLCSNTLSCIDYAADQLEVCIQNTSVSGKYSLLQRVSWQHTMTATPVRFLH